jgi:hypothetical protein
MKISIDLDGVMADFGAAFQQVSKRVFPGLIPDNYRPTAWHWPIMTKEQENEIWAAVNKVPNFWLDVRPMFTNMNELVNSAWNEDDIFFVTSRATTVGDSVLSQSTRWVRKYIFAFRPFSVIPVEHGKDKGRIFDAAGIEASIDDYDVNVREAIRLAAKYKNGHKAFLLDQPWNTAAADLDHVRVKSIAEFFQRARAR